MKKILFVEDDLGLNEGVRFGLKKKGYEVASFTHGLKCLEGMENLSNTYDLAILDVGLPDINGFLLAKRLKKFYDMPVVFLTAKDEEKDMLEGYDLGCEDYITKPFSLPVLLEKVRVILCRAEKKRDEEVYVLDDLYLDFKNKLFKKENTELKFTVKEMDLLEVLVDHKNQILTREQLLECVWDIDGEFVDENTLSVNIRRLRKKIEKDPKNPKRIKTVFGIGYKWCDE